MRKLERWFWEKMAISHVSWNCSAIKESRKRIDFKHPLSISSVIPTAFKQPSIFGIVESLFENNFVIKHVIQILWCKNLLWTMVSLILRRKRVWSLLFEKNVRAFPCLLILEKWVMMHDFDETKEFTFPLNFWKIGERILTRFSFIFL